MKVLKFFLWIGAILGVLGLIAYATVFDVWTVPGDDPKLAMSVSSFVARSSKPWTVASRDRMVPSAVSVTRAA